MIPFFDLKSINQRFEIEFKTVYKRFLDSGYYILGPEVEAFEQAFANYCGTEYCIGVGNGLEALTLILKGYKTLGLLKDGDEVLVPANTYIASILSVIHANLVPVFVEPDPETYTIDPTRIAMHLTSRTRAILAVHLYGQLADMEALSSLAETHDLLVLEDAAQAHGAVGPKGTLAGNLGHAAGFSFYPTKNLGALGDGGGITTNDKALYEVLCKLRNYGSTTKYVNEIVGYNSRLDTLQAMLLNVKLKTLDADNTARIAMAKHYLDTIDNPKIKLPYFSGNRDHVFHQFVIQTEDRNALAAYLKDAGVGTLIHYPIAPHHQEALADYKHLKLPITEQLHKNVLSLPIHPVLSLEDRRHIIQLLNAY